MTSAADQNANVIFGAVIDENLKDEVRVTVIATGFGAQRRRAAADRTARRRPHWATARRGSIRATRSTCRRSSAKTSREGNHGFPSRGPPFRDRRRVTRPRLPPGKAGLRAAARMVTR